MEWQAFFNWELVLAHGSSTFYIARTQSQFHHEDPSAKRMRFSQIGRQSAKCFQSFTTSYCYMPGPNWSSHNCTLFLTKKLFRQSLTHIFMDRKYWRRRGMDSDCWNLSEEATDPENANLKVAKTRADG